MAQPPRRNHAPILRGEGIRLTDQGAAPNVLPSDVIPGVYRVQPGETQNYSAARDWIRDGGVLREGSTVPAAARDFFQRALGTGVNGQPVTVFDARGRLTHEGAEQIGRIQEQFHIHQDNKIGRQTFNALFERSYTQAPARETAGDQNVSENRYQSVLNRFATEFYNHRNATVRPGANGEFDMNDPRVSNFREGLQAVREALGDPNSPAFGRNSQISPERLAHMREQVQHMLAHDGHLTTADVRAFQGILRDAGFRQNGQPIRVTGQIDSPTAQGMMNFALINRTMNPDMTGQTILAARTPAQPTAMG